ncbi:ribonuclease H-like [Stegodyphus dumicola]|uniref:ribonuclease H-like n=1 Tax=Stegodyphus dumicola TaxID=202533 RepID=UPI0015AE6CBD|nr:ribonuclease H-like [Stegodyphus dumicola]
MGVPCGSRETVRQKQKLSQIQRSVLLCITKCYSTSPTSALQVLSGLMPLDIKAEMERKFFRLIHYKENLEISNLVIWYNTLEERVPHFHTHPAHQDILPWHKNTPTQKNIEIFTDGSKIGKHVGAAFVMYNNGHEVHSEIYRLNDTASVFQAEVLALKKALIWIGSTITDNIPIRIFTDSRSSLQSLNSDKITKRSILSLKEIIKTLLDSHSLELNWIKAHIGIAGNERADSEAKRATQQD